MIFDQQRDTGNVAEFYSISKRVVAVVIKLNRRYKLKVAQAYAPTSSYEDEAVDSFYEDVELAMIKVLHHGGRPTQK